MSQGSPRTADQPAFIQAQYRFAAHIRDPEHEPVPADVEDRRMSIYRELFYNNIENFLENGFPVLRRITDDDHWHEMVRDFMVRHHSHSPLFMEIPREFLVYLESERGTVAGDPPFLWELAHYEWVELALSVAEDPKQASDVMPNGDLLENCPVISPLAWPLTYHFPVHRISPEFLPESPGSETTQLLVYRDGDDEVGFLELNLVSARLMGLILEDPARSGQEILQQITTELGHPEPGTVISGGIEILTQWRDMGIVEGARRQVSK